MIALLTDNLPLLTDAPNGIKKLRNLILGLAMRGKLVPQDPNDEPASELLKRIADEKVRLAAQGKTKKQKSLADVTGEEKLFDLPKGWERVRFGVLIELISGQHLGPEEYFGDPKDHMSTPSIPTEERRKELAEEGKETIQVLVERMNVPHIAEQMKNLEAYNQEIAKRCPWVPFAQE